MQVNIQHVLHEQKANVDHFNDLKNFNFKHHSQHFKYLPDQKTRGVSNREGASIRIQYL